MTRAKRKQLESKLDQLLGEASWLLSHAESLTDYGRAEEAEAELARAAKCEEQVAFLLDAAGREIEAVTHRHGRYSTRPSLRTATSRSITTGGFTGR